MTMTLRRDRLLWVRYHHSFNLACSGTVHQQYLLRRFHAPCSQCKVVFIATALIALTFQTQLLLQMIFKIGCMYLYHRYVGNLYVHW